VHAGHSGIKGHADDVEIVTGIRDKLFLGDPAHGLDLVAIRAASSNSSAAGFFHPRDQLRQHLIVFSG
jgi:hypothetical protein